MKNSMENILSDLIGTKVDFVKFDGLFLIEVSLIELIETKRDYHIIRSVENGLLWVEHHGYGHKKAYYPIDKIVAIRYY